MEDALSDILTLDLDPEATKQKYGPWAVIAGGSDGTGEAYARHLASVGINIMLVARRAEVLDALASDLRAAYNVETRTLVQDLMAPDAARNMLDAAADIDVGIYVSNAGCDGTGAHFFKEPVERWHRLASMNVRTLTEAVHGFGNRFIARGSGGIVVMSSGGGLGGTPYLSMYSATKGFELVLVEGLWGELIGTGVEIVCVIAPAMDTPFFRREIAGEDFIIKHLFQPDEVTKGGLEGLGKTPMVMFESARRKDPETVVNARHEELLQSLEAGKSFFKKGEKVA